MNKVNFGGMKSIKTPQEWLDKAAVIPEQPQKKRAFPLYRYAAIASIVLVSVIGLLIFLFFGGSEPVGVRNSPIDADTSHAGRTDETGNPEIGTAEATGAPATDANGDPVIGSEDVSTSAQGKKKTSTTDPTQQVRPTQSSGKASEPTRSPTQETPLSTQAPTSAAAAADPPAPTDLPATPATQAPTEGYRPPGDTEFYGMFTLDDPGVMSGGHYVAEETTIFCRIYDSNGNMVGDSGLFSPQREATILSKYDNGTVVAFYNPVEKGLYITEDAYEYVFYDIHGNEFYHDIKFVF